MRDGAKRVQTCRQVVWDFTSVPSSNSDYGSPSPFRARAVCHLSHARLVQLSSVLETIIVREIISSGERALMLHESEQAYEKRESSEEVERGHRERFIKGKLKPLPGQLK